MRAADHEIRLLPHPGLPDTAEPGKTEWLLPLAVSLAIAAVLVATIFGLPSERRAIRALPGEDRVLLLSRTVGVLREFCGEGRPEGLKGHCRELASFAAGFDECRGECEALVRRQLTPTR